jgi:hypothetical protein
MKRLAPIALCLIASPVLAAGSFADLPRLMPAGQWRLDYDRLARIKMLHYKKADKGASDTCIGADPRAMIHDWLEDKHCTIGSDTLIGKSWRLSGECRVKWTKKPVPIDVEITLAGGKSFVMKTSTPHGSFLEFQELATATRVAPTCAAKVRGG